jgi:hypothetical protein
MSIRPSAAADVSRLIGELISDDPQRRDLAAARLAVIGPRATTALLKVAGDAEQTAATRTAALDTLAAIGDARASTLALSLVTHADEGLAVAAIDLLGQVARSRDGRGTRALDALAALVTSADAQTTRRLAGLTALEGQPERLLKPLYEALAKDPASRVVARVTRRQTGAVESLETLVSQGLPSDPAVLAAVVREDADATGVTVLKKLVEAIRSRERAAGPDEQATWAAVRGAVHQQLAARGSRLALYDLRETLEAAHGPLPVGFLSAAAAIGDIACLTPLAHAWVQAAHVSGGTEDDDRWWREHLADAFRAIVGREAVTRRHPVLKKILEKWPAAGVLVAMAKR